MSNGTQQKPLALECKCHTADGFLHVRYKTTNTGTSPLLTYDGAPGDLKQEWPNLTDQVYVSFQAPATAELKRVRAPVPPKMRITQIKVPTVYRLQPGESRQVQFRLALPLVERSEYFPHFAGATYKDRRATQVQLWIGYFKPTEETKLDPVEGDGNAFRAHGQFAPQAYVTATSPVMLEVRVRTDDKFQRV